MARARYIGERLTADEIAAREADWRARWWVVAAVAIVAALWLLSRGLKVDVGSFVRHFGADALFLVYAAVICRIRTNVITIGASDFLGAVAQIGAFTAIGATLTYLSAGIGSNSDDALRAIDELLGFDWDAVYAWSTLPGIKLLLTASYASEMAQIFLILFLSCAGRPLDRGSELIWNFIFCGLACAAFSMFLPALGHPAVSTAEANDVFEAIRHGTWTTMDLRNVQGIVTFPSFHTALAVVLAYCARHRTWTFVLFGVVDCLVILSTPAIGGHYLIDVLAGIVLAGISIVAVRKMRRSARLRPCRSELSAGQARAASPRFSAPRRA